MNPKAHPVFEQISLFDDAYTLFNSGLADLIALNLQTARDSFERYAEIYRAQEQMADFLKVVDFLEKKLAQIPDSDEKPACLYDLLNTFETDAETVACLSKDIRDGIRSSFQRRILQAIEDYHLCDAPYLSNSVPTGYVYLQAGRPAEAIRALQACLPLSPRNSLIYGYLGDAYAMRNEFAQARQCYLNACLNDPKAVDWNFLQDSDLVSLKDRLMDRYGNEALALEWLPVHAMFLDLFKPNLLGFYEGLKELVEDYLALQKKFQRAPEPELKARLFLRALLLCNQEAHLRFIKTVNFIDLRKMMKNLDAGLFAKYLKWIEKRKSTSK
ncbi:hypothetical protein SAMN04489760_103151 [Syntrophus gentianae]|uniref:Uncharacterized protein n=1 Tax=Syntrophus gentianae TaxID=43775 RepID=A0A1H7VBY5_9BACT|nr:tetratricopeptide repeat protein [Syntrophus gentianae]SEM06560.1 hypothetical protein SAMN04489760_103151 [Syntrophus gentianae]